MKPIALAALHLTIVQKKPLMLKRRYSEFFEFDKELKRYFDKASYGIPTWKLGAEKWIKLVNRRIMDLNFYIQTIGKEEDIVRSKLYKEFLLAY